MRDPLSRYLLFSKWLLQLTVGWTDGRSAVQYELTLLQLNAFGRPLVRPASISYDNILASAAQTATHCMRLHALYYCAARSELEGPDNIHAHARATIYAGWAWGARTRTYVLRTYVRIYILYILYYYIPYTRTAYRVPSRASLKGFHPAQHAQD